MNTLIPRRRRGPDLMDPFRQEMDDLFLRFFEPRDGNGQTGVQTLAPRVDVKETDKEIVVKADLPGFDAKDVDVSVVDDTLILRGEKKEEKKEDKKGYKLVERFEGQFYREIPLPPGTDPDKIVASCSKGVVTVTIARKPELQPRKVPVISQD